ncbi:hypothetical protein N8976_03820 [Gammaproteobacteria bacterium]|nr:hypothetical protein [Gammaproteobacteria bacterium]
MNLTKQQKEKLSSLIESFVDDAAEERKEIVKKKEHEEMQQEYINYWINSANLIKETANKLDDSTIDQQHLQNDIIKQLENSLIKRIKYNRAKAGCGCLFYPLSMFLLWSLYMIVTEGF